MTYILTDLSLENSSFVNRQGVIVEYKVKIVEIRSKKRETRWWKEEKEAKVRDKIDFMAYKR
ncbi:hypothetical protein KBB92_02095 [Candidatus Shapirobacteria bacterium]|nr:hypothetical protein [Candidatus Shapirobacteria bacterium]HQI13316.1 hypothetical protein [Candidatus Woesebacteria bacterium]